MLSETNLRGRKPFNIEPAYNRLQKTVVPFLCAITSKVLCYMVENKTNPLLYKHNIFYSCFRELQLGVDWKSINMEEEIE